MRCRTASAGSATARSTTSARRLSVPPAEAWGVVTFYHLLATEPTPADRRACVRRHRVPPERRRAALSRSRSRAGSTIKRSPCLGQCDKGSAALVTTAGVDARALRRSPRRTWNSCRTPPLELREPLEPLEPLAPEGSCAASAASIRRASTPIESAAATPRWRRRSRWAPAAIVAEVTASKLMGRGGAAFPTGRKWEAVSREVGRRRTTWCATPTSPSRGPSRIAC